MDNLTQTALSVHSGTSLLRVALGLFGYHPHATAAIAVYAREEGTTEGAPGLEPEDAEAAAEAYEVGCPTTPWTSHEWGSATGQESEWNPLDDTYSPAKPEQPEPDPLDEADPGDLTEPTAPDEHYEWPQREHYHPTPEDWLDYARWADEADGMSFPRTATEAERVAWHLAAVEEHRRDQ